MITPLVASIGFWRAVGWIPGMPSRRAGIGSMVRFGGTLTLSNVIAYIGLNADKVMIGRFLGVDAIGIYGRGFQLASMPTDNLNWAVGEVAFSALSRVQNDRTRLKSYFLKSFSFVLGLTVPITVACALFADDVVIVLLGPKWQASIEIVRLLAPTIVVMAVLNPMTWLINSLGLVRRGLKIVLNRLRTYHDCGQRLGAVVWHGGGSVRLFGGNGVVGGSACCMVRARHADLAPRRRGSCRLVAAGLRCGGGRGRLRRPADVRGLPLAIAKAHHRDRRAGSDVLCSPGVRGWAEGALRRSPARLKQGKARSGLPREPRCTSIAMTMCDA